MAAQFISILSQNNDDKKQLKQDFEAYDYQITVFSDIDGIMKHVSTNPSILIMIDYNLIVSADRTKVIGLFKVIKSTRSVVFNVPEDTDRRLAFYELGATRVFDKSYALENITHSVIWLANVLYNSEDSKRLYSKGQLEDISLTTLINTLGSENRSGILKIVTDNNSGKIYFCEGNIVSAEVGSHRGEKAIIHMLFWKKGNFSFSSSQNDDPERAIEISNNGILILSQIYHNRFKINLEKLGKPTSTLRAQNIGDLTSTFEDIDHKFIDYISRPKTIVEIIENPYYSCFETLEILVRFKEKNFLLLKEAGKTTVNVKRINDNVSKASPNKDVGYLLQTQDINAVKKNLKLKNSKSFNVLLISTQDIAASDFINDLGPSKIQVQQHKKYNVIEVALSDQLNMQVYALQINKHLMDTFKLLKEAISGLIFIIEIKEDLDFEYINYIIRQICTITKAPTVLAVANSGSVSDFTELMPNFKVPEQVQIIPFDHQEGQKSIRQALMSLKPKVIKDEKSKA